MRRNNILDIFITNKPSLITQCHAISGISDHEVVSVKSLVQVNFLSSKRRIYLWRRVNLAVIKNIVSEFSSTFLQSTSQTTPVNLLWEEFKTVCLECLNCVPSRILSTNKNRYPWITHNIRRLPRQKQCTYNIAKATRLPHRWQAYSISYLKEKLRRNVDWPTEIMCHH